MRKTIKVKLQNLLWVSLLALLVFPLAACGGGGKSGGMQSPYKQVGGSGIRSSDSSDTERLNNLEQRIDIIETDLRQLRPSIEGLVAIEKDIQDLVRELAGLTGERDTLRSQMGAQMGAEMGAEMDFDDFPAPQQTRAAATSAPTPLTAGQEHLIASSQETKPTEAPAQAPAQSKVPAPVSSKFTNEITEVRVAPHSSNKVRMVIDFKPNSNIQYDIKQNGSNITLTVPQTGWSAQKTWSSAKMPLISGYSMKPFNNGAEMIINTRGDDLTVRVFTLGPVRAGAGPRLVIDFEKGV